MPLALKIVTCPWHFEMFALFTHPVNRLSSQKCFLLQICLDPRGCLELPLSCLGVSVLLGWVSFVEKGPSQTVSLSPSFPLGTLQINHHWLWCPLVLVWAVSSPPWSKDIVCTGDTHGQSSSWMSTKSLHSAARSKAPAKCQTLSHYLAVRECKFHLTFEVRYRAAALNQLMVMPVSECPHAMGPTLGAKFVSWVLLLPSLGDGSCSGPMVNVDWKLYSGSLVWQEWCLVCICINGVVQTITIKARKSGKWKDGKKNKEKGLYNEQEQSLNNNKQQIPKLIKPLYHKLQLKIINKAN